MPISTIGYDIQLFGKPIVLYIGMLTIFLVALQVFIAFENLRLGKNWIPFGVHRVLGYVTLVVAVVHATLVSLYWL